MNATHGYGSHHAYAEPHHVPPPHAAHHHPVPYQPPPYHHPHHTSMMPPPPPPPHAAYYAPHYAHSAPPPNPHVHHHHHPPPSYGPVAPSSQPMTPASSYATYPHPPGPHHMTLPAIAAPPPSATPNTGSTYSTAPERKPDTTGQIQPPNNLKPKVAATLWEDEGTLCFQVEANNICVTRRHDNHMINGTKLLNVAKMTRGRRDGMLKTEKMRKVMKVGPMHLKGVWIPFDRALEMANRENITEQLYPLFMHNIDQLLSSTNNGNGPPTAGQVVSGRLPAPRARSSSTASETTPRRSALPGPQAEDSTGVSARHPPSAQGRPSLERAHTLPQPPSTAADALSGGSFELGGSSAAANGQGHPDSKSLPVSPHASPQDQSLSATQRPYPHLGVYERQAIAVPAQYPLPHAYHTAHHDMGPPRYPPSYDTGTYHPSAHHVVNTDLSPQSRSSPHTAPGSSSDSAPGHWAYPQPHRNVTLPSQHGAYAPNHNAATNGYDVSGSSSHAYYSSTTGSSAKRGRDDEDEATLVEADMALKRQKTADAAKARYQPQRSSGRR